MRRLALALAVVAVVPAHGAEVRPATVPAVRSAADWEGTFELRKGARVVIARKARRRLAPEAKLLAADLGIKWKAAPKGRPGDVILRTGSKLKRLGAEGYTIRIEDRIKVRARTAAGIFYAGRTLVQLFDGRKRVERTFIRDWPLYPERGLMIDNGRQFFPRAWLEARIKELSDLKLNLLHLHFSDNQGYRLQSDTHPEIVTEPYLTKADVRKLVALARRRHLTIIPELDSPGHLEAALKPHPEFQLANRLGQKQPDKLDVTNPDARAFIGDLLGEYLPLFPGPWWHTGADEYLGVASTEQDYELYPQLEAYADEKYGEGANGKDAVIDFINFVDEKVRAAGKRTRIWSDGMGGGSGLVELAPTAAVEWWENRTSEDPNVLMTNGRQVQNAGWWPLYYVTGGPLESARASEQDFYENWNAWHFEGPWSTRWAGGEPTPPPYFVPEDAKNQLGAQLNVWNDDPGNMSEDEIAEGIRPRLRILAQKTWGSPQLTDSYEEFKALAR